MQSRRDFLKASGVVLGALSVSGASGLLFAQDSKKPSNDIIIQTLNNGVKMPIIGLGTYSLWNKECEKAIEDALAVGYRAFDSAQMYSNEKEIGNAIKQSGIKREEIFITTKLSSDLGYEDAKKSIESSLNALGVDYVDLFLVHKNYSHAKEMYKALEDFYKEKRLKAIGISNFDIKEYEDFIKTCEFIPMINQVQVHAFYQREALQKTLNKNGTIMQAWSPFAKGGHDFFNNPTLNDIGKKYNKTAAQVGLRYLVERGINVIPKTSKKERMIENLNVFDFTLSAQDMENIKALDTDKSLTKWGA